MDFMDFERAEEYWITADQCFNRLEDFKSKLRSRAGGVYARFKGTHGVWIVSPQKKGSKARVSFVYNPKEAPVFVR